jgi:hypothetical protein
VGLVAAMYFQLSVKVKLIVIVKVFLPPSPPDATVTEDEDERPAPPEQAPVPSAPLTFATVTFEQVAVTAEAGSVVQPVNVDDPACTPTVQVRAVEPPRSVNATVAADDPDTEPKSGSVAEKLIVEGLAVIVVMLVTRAV